MIPGRKYKDRLLPVFILNEGFVENNIDYLCCITVFNYQLLL